MRLTPNRFSADAKEGSTPVLLSLYSRLCAIGKSVRWYFGTPLPLRGGFPPRIHSRPAVHTQRMGVFLPVLRTSFSVRLYAAFMRAYAAYRRPQNIEYYSIWQKKHPFTCVCAVFVVSLQPILYSRMDLTACNLVKRMLKLVPQEQTVTCGYFF